MGSSYKAKGVEPFWALDITAGTAVFSRPSGTGTETKNFSITEDDK
jgi:uncharacterized membrane protein